MISGELNERLTQTGPGTPMGNLLRRYWQPIGTRVELEKEPVQPIRLLSEDLTLFRLPNAEFGMRNESGPAKGQSALPNPQSAIRYGLIGERCAHRGLSLAYGIPQENGLRCAYHGWTYNTEGRVVDMPFEPACLPLKVKAYPVEELGGLVWAYLGPEPRPLLRRFDGFVREDVVRSVSFKVLPCSWLQCMDNSHDPVHFEHLHAHYGNYYNRRHDKSAAMNPARHVKIDFDVFEYGIYKRRLLEGEPEDSDDWRIGHPVLFPNILERTAGVTFGYEMRIPIDDTHTMHTVYSLRKLKPGQGPQELQVTREAVRYNELGLVDAPAIILQDEMAWIGQGPITDRTVEHLTTSDKGILAYRNLLLENIEKVERGEDPLGTLRDPAKNLPFIEIRTETEARRAFGIEAAGRV